MFSVFIHFKINQAIDGKTDKGRKIKAKEYKY